MTDGLTVAAGLASRTGRRPDNQDFCAVWQGDAARRARTGVLAVLADGVGGAKGGRVAAELACREWIDGYLDAPPRLGVAAAAQRALAPYNAWLHGLGRTDAALLGAATTFAALVLRGRDAHALHVGDSRIWHFRAGALNLLTTDHTPTTPDRRHMLYRAIGLDSAVRLDHAVQPLQPHDRLLITSDGVHATLSAATLTRLLAARGAAVRDAEAIVAAALAAGSADNASAVVLDVLTLPAPNEAGIAAYAAALPVPPPPNQGETIDGFLLDRLISDQMYSRVFAATDQDGGACVLKFPKPAMLSDRGARLAFTRESLIGARITSPHVVEILTLPPDRQTRLYVAMRHHPGETLSARLLRGSLPWQAGLPVAIGLTRGVAALHRRGIIHRDIKPDNVLLPPADGAPANTVRLLDLGVAHLPAVPEFDAAEIPGTPGYLAPELYESPGTRQGDPATDQFALGVTLFQLFTGRMPFGPAEPFSRPRFTAPADPAAHCPNLPGWLAAALARTIALRPADRFADMLELLDALEGGSTRAAPIRARRSLIDRHPQRFWQVLSILLALLLWLSLATR